MFPAWWWQCMYTMDSTFLLIMMCTVCAQLYYVTMFAMIRAWDLYNSYRQLATMSHNAQPHATSTQLSWVNDMMAHVEPDRVSEFSTSGTSGDVSVFWEPDSLCMTDPFVLHAPSPQPPPQWKFPTPSSPSSPTPDVKLSKLSADILWPSESPLLLSTGNEEKKSHTVSRSKYGGATLEHLMRVVSEWNPYAAKHAHKTQMWKDVHEAMKKWGYFQNTSYAGVCNKMGQLLKC